MADVLTPQKKPNPIKDNLGTIGSVAGSMFGPAGGAAGGMVGNALSSSGNKGSFQSISAPQRRMAMQQLERGLNAAKEVGDQESLQTIEQAMAMAKPNQPAVSNDAVARRMARYNGGVA